MLTTKEFSEVTGVPVGTLKRWRSKPRGSCEGRQGVLVPAVVDKRGRCFYTDAQIDIARQLHNPHYGQPTLFEEMTHMPTNETATADNAALTTQVSAPQATVDTADDQTPADAQNTVKIDDEFKNLIPPLADDEFQQLEENLLRDGIQDSLKTWRGILIDGHNRYQIAQKHGLPFKVTEMEFADRDAVKMWIVQNQFGRRNVNRFSRGELALKLEPSIAAQAKANQQLSEGRGKKGLANLPNLNTRDELAKIAGVSSRLMAMIQYLVEHAADEIKVALRADKLTINSAFNGVKAGAKTVADVEMFKGYSHGEPALQLEAAITARAKENLSTHTADGYQRLANVPKGESNDPPCADPARNDESTDYDQQAAVVEAQDDSPVDSTDNDSDVEVVGGQVNRICDNKVAGIVTFDDTNDIADVGNQNVPAQVVTDGEDTVQHDDRDAVKTLLDRVAVLIRNADDDALSVARATLTRLVATLEKNCPPLTPTGNQ